MDQTLPPGLVMFLETEHLCNLAVLLPNNEVHAAPLVCYADSATLHIYMATDRSTQKMRWHDTWESTRAAVTIGAQKRKPYLLQFRGQIRECSDRNNASVKKFMSIVDKRDTPSDPKNILLEFTPSWVRYSHWRSGTKKEFQL